MVWGALIGAAVSAYGASQKGKGGGAAGYQRITTTSGQSNFAGQWVQSNDFGGVSPADDRYMSGAYMFNGKPFDETMTGKVFIGVSVVVLAAVVIKVAKSKRLI